MQKFHFRPGKSALMSLVTGGAALIAGWTWWSGGSSFWLGLALLCAAGAAKMLMDVLSDTPALAFDDERVRVRTTWGGVAEISWGQVQQVTVDVMTLRYLGIIPIARHETLVIKCNGGLFGSRRVRLALKLVQLPPGGAAQLLAMLESAHVVALGAAATTAPGRQAGSVRPQVGRSSGNSIPTGEAEASGFDADAALARYLARKEAAAAAMPGSAPAATPLPARPQFGRKPLAG